MSPARRPSVALLDYGMGNLHSVGKALEVAGAEVTTTSRPDDLDRADALVLPGVGAFPRAMERLGDLGLAAAIERAVGDGRPLLGICLGLQLLFDFSEEQGGSEGLGILPGRVIGLEAEGLKVPHIGWARVEWDSESPLRRGITDDEAFYFVHSFVAVPADEDRLASATYGGPFACAAGRDGIFGVQFHPEKSSDVGLRLLANFVSISAERLSD